MGRVLISNLNFALKSLNRVMDSWGTDMMLCNISLDVSEESRRRFWQYIISKPDQRWKLPWKPCTREDQRAFIRFLVVLHFEIELKCCLRPIVGAGKCWIHKFGPETRRATTKSGNSFPRRNQTSSVQLRRWKIDAHALLCLNRINPGTLNAQRNHYQQRKIL